MARVNGKPGKWSKTQAERTFDRISLAYVGVAALGGAFFGFAVAKGWSLPGGVAVLLMIMLGLSFNRLFNRPLTAIGKQRLKFWRGAQVEALVGWLLGPRR